MISISEKIIRAEKKKIYSSYAQHWAASYMFPLVSYRDSRCDLDRFGSWLS